MNHQICQKAKYVMIVGMACVIFFVAPLYAASKPTETDRIDADYNSCLSKADGVTSNIRDCTSKAYPSMDKRLNQLFKTLMGKLPANNKELLKNAQKKWLAFRDAEKELSLELDPEKGGTMQMINADSFAYEMLKKRVKDLEGYLAGLD